VFDQTKTANAALAQGKKAVAEMKEKRNTVPALWEATLPKPAAKPAEGANKEADLKYRMFNASSSYLIDRAAALDCNWVIAHSFGIEEPFTDPRTGRQADMYPIYFEDYPKVAQVRHYQEAGWLEPLRRTVRALCERAAGNGLKVAFHSYEPVLPHIFEREYPDLVGVWKRPTQAGTIDVHTHLNPDNPAVWDLLRSKYAEVARDFPLMDMIIITTWDGAGSYWCVPQAKMPIPDRLAKMALTAREGVRSVRKDCQVCFRLWGRNWPAEMYRDGHNLIAQMTGLANAGELMQPVVRPHNDPEKVLPAVLAQLPPDVPIMYKSTNIDIGDGQQLARAAGTYPAEREQILEISYENYFAKPWPWCKLRHIRRGLLAVEQRELAGFLCLSTNMGNDDRDINPDTGNLGRMNTWLLEKVLRNDGRGDAELVSAWLAEQFGGTQPQVAAEVLLEAEDIVDKGMQWGGGAHSRFPFSSLHTTKLYWTFDGYADPSFPYRMANPTRGLIEDLIAQRAAAHDRARQSLEKIKAARAAMHPGLYQELTDGFTLLADSILLARDWSSYLLMQYGIEKGLFPADRPTLGRMSRYVEQFIRNLAELRDTPAGKRAISRLAFPDPFPPT
jgi:hypothetical protein